MALGTCGWIGAFLCCVLCSGAICFMIFGGTVIVGFLALFSMAHQCEGADLEATKVCIPITSELINATINFEPKFESTPELEILVKKCAEATKCVEGLKCLSPRRDLLETKKKNCNVFTFIKDEFGLCAEKLKKKDDVECVKFLFQDKKCGKWLENQECLEEEIRKECGVAVSARFTTMSKWFFRGACEGVTTSRR